MQSRWFVVGTLAGASARSATRSYTGCDIDGEYPEDSIFDLDVMEIVRRGHRFINTNVTLENFLKQNRVYEHYAALPYFTDKNYFFNEFLIKELLIK